MTYLFRLQQTSTNQIDSILLNRHFFVKEKRYENSALNFLSANFEYKKSWSKTAPQRRKFGGRLFGQQGGVGGEVVCGFLFSMMEWVR